MGAVPWSDLPDVLEELARERYALAASERAEIEGRVANRDEWVASLDRRRTRIVQLVDLRDELYALEEAAAELAEVPRGEAA